MRNSYGLARSHHTDAARDAGRSSSGSNIEFGALGGDVEEVSWEDDGPDGESVVILYESGGRFEQVGFVQLYNALSLSLSRSPALSPALSLSAPVCCCCFGNHILILSLSLARLSLSITLCIDPSIMFLWSLRAGRGCDEDSRCARYGTHSSRAFA